MNHMKQMQHVCALLVGAVLASASGGIAAQSLESSASIGVSNLDYGGGNNLLSLSYDSADGGVAEVGLASTPFTGLNGSGSTDTLSFAGGASAFVGLPCCLHAAVHGSLLNTFYNSANPPYFDATVTPPTVDEDGVPDFFYAFGKAGMVELLSYGGFGASQYYASYHYRIHGQLQGDSFPMTAFMIFQVGNNPQEVAVFEPNLPNGWVVADYVTQRYLVANGMSHEQKSTFYAWYQADTQSVPEGTDISGSFDFSHTITLDYIDVVDENNDPVYGWTVTSDSDMDYDLPIFRDDFDPVAVETQAFAPNAVEICARLDGVEQDAPMVLRRTASYCDQPLGAVREIKFRQVGASEVPAQD